MSRSPATLLATLALLLSAAAPGSQAAEPTVVLVTQDLATLHRVQGSYSYSRSFYQPYYSDTASMLGVSIGTAIGEQHLAIVAQKKHNETLLPLTETLGDKGLRSIVRLAINEALAENEMDVRSLAFFAESKADERMLKRMKVPREASRFVFVENGRFANGVMMMPLAMPPHLRQLRLSVDIEVREGKPDRSRRVAKRDIVYFSTPSALEDEGQLLEALASDEHAALRKEVGDAFREAISLALSDREFPDVSRDDRIGAMGPAGLSEFNGVLLEHTEGRALIWTRGGSLVSVPAERVITGAELDAARESVAP